MIQNKKEDEVEDPTMVSRMTYIKAPTNEPVNLDMSDFDKQMGGGGGIGKETEK